MHFYVFFYRADSQIPFYDRTFGRLDAALKRVRELGDGAFVSVDSVPRDFWY